MWEAVPSQHAQPTKNERKRLRRATNMHSHARQTWTDTHDKHRHARQTQARTTNTCSLQQAHNSIAQENMIVSNPYLHGIVRVQILKDKSLLYVLKQTKQNKQTNSPLVNNKTSAPKKRFASHLVEQLQVIHVWLVCCYFLLKFLQHFELFLKTHKENIATN